jgi:glycosyltransferase involved in cell wall biosynthesis
MVTRLRPEPLAAPPRVSVVIPCYNYGRFLPDCVRSVLDQPGVDVDVLVVDDASPDNSGEVARRIAATDPRVRVREHAVNRGHIATYNDGLASVTGDYLVLLSADDLLTPGSLARSAALLAANPGVGMVYGHSTRFVDRPPRARTAVRSWTVWAGEEWIDLLCRGVTNPVSTPDVMMRSTLMRTLVGYDTRLPHAADLLLWLRVAARSAIGRINGAGQAFYRTHGNNMHVERYGGAYADFIERVRTFEIFFEEDGEHLGDRPGLRDLARRALAREALAIAARAGVLAHYRGEPVEKFVSLARELSPPSESPELWRAYQRYASRTGKGLIAGVRRRVDVVTDDAYGRLRWRRWRRSGMYSAVRSI